MFYVYIYPTPPPSAGCDTRSVLGRRTASLNSEFSIFFFLSGVFISWFTKFYHLYTGHISGKMRQINRLVIEFNGIWTHLGLFSAKKIANFYIYIFCIFFLHTVMWYQIFQSSVASSEKDIETRLAKAWTAINRLSIIWKSDLTNKMKRSFFQAAVTSILLYGCTTWTLTKRLEKKLDGNYTRMLRAILNKSWRQHPTRHQLYGHLPPITKTIQVRRTRHAGHCWRSRDELIKDVLLWTPTHGRAKAGRPARTYIQQLCEDTGCCPEDLHSAMNDRRSGKRGQGYPCYQRDMMIMMMMNKLQTDLFDSKMGP